ncbi:porin family protein [Pseudochryseolinea flava]|uniref:Outer membrane protein beta-barrel domain-containing protein n=1 Tax=Pseudochryseolinea flava TaxID=2059302 RepID=A0A364Y281_9BACT|nr:hypothetical protein [Pseudochryseolinea flava]RAW00767.1 hypothetical protein DQQ10_13470 [Pseudochryseolinea flava]
MKKLLLVGFLLVVAQVSYGQYALDKGRAQFNAGLGFSSWGVPIYAGFDYGVHQDISVGGELSYRSYRERYGYGQFRARYRHSIIGIAANGNYHFNTVLDIPREWDFYAGLTLGYYIWNTGGDDYLGDEGSGLGLAAQVGGRYYFNDRFGVNLELGGGSFSGGKFGITIKL